MNWARELGDWGAVGLEAADLEAHSGDVSGHAASLPQVVVWPSDGAGVAGILAWANERGVGVTPWGAGTSVEGNPIPVAGGILLSLARMDRI